MCIARARNRSPRSQKNSALRQIIRKILSISKILPLNPAKQKLVTIANAKGQDSIKETRNSDLPNASVRLNKKGKKEANERGGKKNNVVLFMSTAHKLCIAILCAGSRAEITRAGSGRDPRPNNTLNTEQ